MTKKKRVNKISHVKHIKKKKKQKSGTEGRVQLNNVLLTLQDIYPQIS